MFAKLNNFYWWIRYTRNKSLKRKYYRYAEKEKKRLIESGVDMEYLRLYCRSLSKRQDLHAESRLERHKKDHVACN